LAPVLHIEQLVNASVGRHSGELWSRGACLSQAMNNPALRENDMKLLPIAAVITTFAFTPVAFAQTTPTTKTDCVKAKMKWDAKGGKDGKGACVAAPAAKDAPKK